MSTNDHSLHLLFGSPIQISNLGALHPLTLKEIMEIGENQYNKYIFASTFKQDDLVIEGRTLTPFETIIVHCYHDENFREIFLDSLTKFFKAKVHFHESGFFYLENLEDRRFIDETKYNEIVEIIKKQNFIKNQEEEKDEFNPYDAAAKEMIERVKKFRQRVKEKNQESGLNLHDIISIVAANSFDLNILSVRELTVYQLYDLYLRLMMRDNYESQYYLLPHVSDSSSLDLRHWARKIEQ